MWKRAAVALIVLLVLAGLLATQATPVAPQPMAEAPVAAVAPVVARPPLATEAPPDAPPPPALAGHAAIAEALGYVAVKCWVGTEWDTDDLVGAFHQKIEGGWYTNVETALTGQHVVQRKYDDPAEILGTGYEILFFVSWSATEPGGVVPCHVEQVEYAELRVRVVDAAGQPLAGARVQGCGDAKEADAAGLAILDEAKAGHECPLFGQLVGKGADMTWCEGRMLVPALTGDEVRDVVLALACRDAPGEDGEDVASPGDPGPPQLPERSDAEELAVLQDLSRRDLGEGGNALITEILAQRASASAWTAEVEGRIARRNALLAEITALDGLEDAASVAERDRLRAELLREMREESEALGLPVKP